MATTFQDTFNRADENPCANNWVVEQGTFQVISNQGVTGTGQTYARHASGVSSTDQWAQVTYAAASFQTGKWVSVRINTTDTSNWAVLAWNGSVCQLGVNIGGSTNWNNVGALSLNDGNPHTLRLERSGNTLTGYVDGTQVGQFTITGTLTGTGVGIEMNPWGSPTTPRSYLTDFQAGDYTSSSDLAFTATDDLNA